MMSDNQTDSETGFRRLVREAKEEAFHARRQLRRELPTPSMGTKLDVAAALSDYRDVLEDYRDETALKTPWDERDVDWIDDALAETTTVEQSVTHHNPAASRESEVPFAATVGARELLRLGKELDAIAKELGFAASAKGVTPGGEAADRDLVDLLSARGQDDAIDRLPKRFQSSDS